MKTHSSTHELGAAGESLAASFLLAHGYEIVDKNWRFKNLEIDLIVRKSDILVFVEVKLLSDSNIREPYTAVTKTKQKRIISAAHQYCLTHEITEEARFDIISIVKKTNHITIKHIESAFHPIS